MIELVDKEEVSRKGNKIHIGNTICCMCGTDKTTIIKSSGIPRWSRYKVDKDGDYNANGIWDRKSYLCTKCYDKIRCINDDRRCSNCGDKTTSSYCKIYDENNKWDGKSWLCNKCFGKKYGDEIIKPTRLCRNKGIAKNSTLGKGVIGEAIVSKVLGIEMCSKRADDFNYKFDLFTHDKYGNIQVKIASPYFDKWCFDFRHGSPCDCDTVILLCMDEEWKNVVKVYIIPSENIEKLGLSICEGIVRISKWNKFQVDEKPYNDAYHILNIDKCSILKSE